MATNYNYYIFCQESKSAQKQQFGIPKQHESTGIKGPDSYFSHHLHMKRAIC